MGFWMVWFPFGIIMGIKIGKGSFGEMNRRGVGFITMRMEQKTSHLIMAPDWIACALQNWKKGMVYSTK